MSLNRKLLVVVGFVLSIVLTACGGGGGAKINPSNSTSTEAVLPFGLDKDDGSAALVFFASSLNNSAYGGIFEISSHNFYSPVIDEDAGLITEIKRQECSSGNINIDDNVPSAPMSLEDYPITNPYTFALTADSCRFDEDEMIMGSFADGLMKGVYSANDEITEYDFKFKDFFTNDLSFGSLPDPHSYLDLQPKKYKALLFSLTGDNYSKLVETPDGAQTLIRKVVKQVYTNKETGFWLELDSLDTRSFFDAGDNNTFKTSYHIKWQMVSPIDGEQEVMPSSVSSFTGPVPGIFSPGYYDLEVNVETPVSSVVNNSDGPTSGHVVINLRSHSISADITYHPGYADILYIRNGLGKTVRKYWNSHDVEVL